jgi:hypothetical protein
VLDAGDRAAAESFWEKIDTVDDLGSGRPANVTSAMSPRQCHLGNVTSVSTAARADTACYAAPFDNSVLHYLPVEVNPYAMAANSSRMKASIAANAAAAVLTGALACGPVHAAAVIVDNWVTRPNTVVRVLVMKANQPANSVMLLPGGHGNLNLDSQGHIGWGEDDFVVRTRWQYFDNGIAAIIPDVALDHKPPQSLAGYRTSALQAEDLHALSEHMRGMTQKVWIVAYDTGATSALNMIARGKADLIAGLVLISPVLEQADPDDTSLIDGVKLALGHMPVLVIAHKFDQCSSPIVDRIKNAAAVLRAAQFRSITMIGGRAEFLLRDPFAYPERSCNARPAHALAGLEDAVSGKIIDWLTHQGSIAAPGDSRWQSAAADASSPDIPPLSQVTALSALPEPSSSTFHWAVVRGLNVQALDADAVVTGQPVLRLIATPNDKGHTLAFRLTGLNKNQAYRISAWVKPVAGGNVELAAFDHPDADTQPNSAEAVFDLYNHQVLHSFGAAQRDIEQHANYWQKVWIELATSDGQFMVAVRPAKGREHVFDGDGRIGVIFGGVEAEPLD